MFKTRVQKKAERRFNPELKYGLFGTDDDSEVGMGGGFGSGGETSTEAEFNGGEVESNYEGAGVGVGKYEVDKTFSFNPLDLVRGVLALAAFAKAGPMGARAAWDFTGRIASKFDDPTVEIDLSNFSLDNLDLGGGAQSGLGEATGSEDGFQAPSEQQLGNVAYQKPVFNAQAAPNVANQQANISEQSISPAQAQMNAPNTNMSAAQYANQIGGGFGLPNTAKPLTAQQMANQFAIWGQPKTTIH